MMCEESPTRSRACCASQATRLMRPRSLARPVCLAASVGLPLSGGAVSSSFDGESFEDVLGCKAGTASVPDLSGTGFVGRSK